MRKLFTLCLLVFTLSASAQWQQTGSKVRYVNGLGIPTKDTAAGVAADSSQIVIRPQDSSLYVKYKRTWLRVGGAGFTGSGTTNYIPKFTSSTAIGNSQIFDNGTSVGIGTTSPATKFVVSNAGASGLEVNPTGGVSSGVLLQAYNRSTSAYMAQSYYALTHTFNTGTAGATRALDISSAGNTLVGTAVDNGVDRLQVSGGLNVSAKATAQNLSVTNSAQITNNLDMGSGTANTNLTMLANSTSSGWAGRLLGRNSSGIMLFQHRNNSATFVDCFYVDGSGGIGNTVFLDRAYIAPGQASTGVLVVNSSTWSGNDELEVNGSISGIGMKQGYVTKTGAYTATNDDYVIDCTTGTFTVTLYAASGNAGRILIVKNSGTGSITVDGNGAETIDGAATQTLGTQWSRITIMCDGANWKIISN